MDMYHSRELFSVSSLNPCRALPKIVDPLVVPMFVHASENCASADTGGRTRGTAEKCGRPKNLINPPSRSVNVTPESNIKVSGNVVFSPISLHDGLQRRSSVTWTRKLAVIKSAEAVRAQKSTNTAETTR